MKPQAAGINSAKLGVSLFIALRSHGAWLMATEQTSSRKIISGFTASWFNAIWPEAICWPKAICLKALQALVLLTLCSLAVMAFPAQAASPTYPSHTLTLAASCAVCHGTDGHSASGMLGLAGMPAAQFIARLQAYRNGSLPATVMHQHARGLTETEIQALAQYFSAQQPGKAVLEPLPQVLDADHD